MNVALVLPAETVTLAGTCTTALLLLVSPTVLPPLGAGPLSVTVPVEESPPTTVAGLKLSPLTERKGGFTVSVACTLPLSVAVIVTNV